ncbi:MAG: HDOD domain-containing protein [Desulfobacteraceae bacterium]|nr:HDOD domain-containing protein [Desulfobacteraceae bacterium]
MQASLAKRLDKLQDLPAMPNTLVMVLDSVSDPDVSIKNIEKILENDPMLATKVLRMANSPYYGAANRVNSIARAILVLGFNEIRNLVIGLSLTGMFSGDLGFEEFNSKTIWLHSLGVAKVCKYLSEHIKDVDPEDMFTAGLIHDLGRFIMAIDFTEELKEMFEMKRSLSIPLSEAEERYGITHSELGAYLAQKWGLSDMLKDVLRYHHAPQNAGPYMLQVATVFLADQLCQKIKLGWDLDGEKNSRLLVPKCLGIDGKIIQDVANRLKHEKSDIENQWGNIIPD